MYCKMYFNSGMMESLHNELKEFNSDVKTTTVLPYFVETNPKVSAFLNLRYEKYPTVSAYVFNAINNLFN